MAVVILVIIHLQQGRPSFFIWGGKILKIQILGGGGVKIENPKFWG